VPISEEKDMRRIIWIVVALLIVGLPVVAWAVTRGDTVEFKEARLRVEINATDGDAGLQIDLDHEPWQSLRLEAPDGRTILDVRNRGVLQGYGLTELFSESSEPPFTEFPLDEFKGLFPEGIYTFTARTVDGMRVRSTFELTHAFPAGPEILFPEEDAELTGDTLVVEWDPGEQPANVEIAAYEVLVVDESDPRHEIDLFLGPDARSLTVPSEFMTPGEYKVEVLAIETSGNQTLTEVAFTVN
jgi:hypothetical protein